MTEHNNKIHNYEIDIEQIENAEVDDLMLSPQQKRLWELYSNMSYTEVADEMDLSPNTISHYLDLIREKEQKAELTLAWMEKIQNRETVELESDDLLDEFDSDEDNSNTDTSQNRNTGD